MSVFFQKAAIIFLRKEKCVFVLVGLCVWFEFWKQKTCFNITKGKYQQSIWDNIN